MSLPRRKFACRVFRAAGIPAIQLQFRSRHPHAEGEKQGKEDAYEGCRVEAVIGWSAVHICQDLKHSYELLVLEFDGRLIFHSGLFESQSTGILSKESFNAASFSDGAKPSNITRLFSAALSPVAEAR